MKNMCLVNKVLFVVYCVAFSVVGGEDTNEDSTQYNEDKKGSDPPVDQHTFVVLIDIVFSDGSKKTCTGTIIHDYVVITAAHCFVSDKNRKSRPELTVSFVVIGTKKMFETGYEQYLPIERVVTHPKYKGWTADLSLVFTFAGMTSDKPGTVISLAGDKTSAPVDSNVTVLSWGHSKDDSLFKKPAHKKKKKKSKKVTKNCSSSESEELDHHFQGTQTRALRAGISEGSSEEAIREHTKKLIDDQLDKVQEIKNDTIIKNVMNKAPKRNGTNEKAKEESQIQDIKLHYKNWRRLMSPQQNKLTVEVFGFVNMQTCKKVVEKAMPEIYGIKGVTDIVCYASDEHLITAEDSGAPAIRHGQLVAVTVGGAECDGDHVAVGMKMSCYCSWIADNLPSGGPRLHCCKNCCDVTHLEEHKHKPPTPKYFNKYLI